MRNIDIIREVTSAAAGKWPYVLAGLSIDVPDSSRRHAPCPACGGTDRFRFDDNGRGSFICNQCGAGDGLDLIKKVNNCDTTEAASLPLMCWVLITGQRKPTRRQPARGEQLELTASSVSRSARNRQQRTQSSEGLRLPVCMPECARDHTGRI
jgi:putative DNA primase/helicase